MSVNKSLAAVVVTFNRSEKLVKVLDAISAQTRKPDVTYVIDNASTDNTREVVENHPDPSISYVRLPENIGGAGGFHEGLRIAYEAGHDLFWISDDDAYPEADAIQVLVDRTEGFEADTNWRPGFACSRVNWTDGSLCEMNVPNTVWDWPRWFTKDRPVFLVVSCSFVSVLVPRWAVAAHGLPIKEYFIWHDDVEYTLRLSKSYPGIYCPESVVVHDIPENKGAAFHLVNDSNLWKYKYGARNEASRLGRDNGFFHVIVYLVHIHKQMRSGGVGRRNRLQIYKSTLRGYFFRPQIVHVPRDEG